MPRTGSRKTKRTKLAVPDEGNHGGFAEARNDMIFDFSTPTGRERIEAVLSTARRSGLLGEKSGRISGRISQALLEQARRQTGLESDTDLIEFALATVALEDGFAEAFRDTRGMVDPSVKLGF